MTRIILTPEQEAEANALAHQWDSFPLDLDDYRQIARELVALRADVKRLQTENCKVLDNNDKLRKLLAIALQDIRELSGADDSPANMECFLKTTKRYRAALKAAGRGE